MLAQDRRARETENMSTGYATLEPARTDVDRLPGPTMVEFGTPWCNYCIEAQHVIVPALADHPRVRHIKVEDGRGRPLGRSFHVKLWPTLIFLYDGAEVARLVRPLDEDPIRAALDQIDPRSAVE